MASGCVSPNASHYVTLGIVPFSANVCDLSSASGSAGKSRLITLGFMSSAIANEPAITVPISAPKSFYTYCFTLILT